MISREPAEDKEKNKQIENIIIERNRKLQLGVLFIQID